MMAQVQSLPSIDTVDNKQSTDELACVTSNEYLYRETDRLRTFTNRWPVPFVQAEELARYGFYYTGSEDTVKCFFCRVEIGMWEEHDNVIEEHLRWSPYCPLLKKRHTNNEPINENFLSAVPEPSFDVCGINMRQHSYAENAGDRMSGDSWVSDVSSTSSTSTGSSVGEASGTISTDRSGLVVRSGADTGGMMLTAASAPHGTMLMGAMRRPEYPNYAIEADRLKSFADWPTSMYQKPQQLSDAGFFYTGNGDRVKCFSCGGGLKDWEQGDEPWEQHGIWYSNCEYLKLIKGHEFIQKCQQMREDEEAQTNGGQHSRPSTSGASSAASSLMSTSPVSSRSGVSSPTAPDDECTLRRCDSGLAAATDDGQQGEDETGIRNISDGKICKICFVNEYNTAFLPCGHVVACAKCASSVTKCPLCQQPFINVLRLYLS
ncbi:death-associated inhibitor of apoptosis 1 [Anopheles bellator]|uniref:death-associated inhibitor of apoptosis 1 n=1 Tax=Anopheles bellator TaxID=139047 RepID=UPI0026495B84|nr:death-associated inhibitor of apoptosis 1 [Anopheles bellator]XP_058067036.1 death-associated inhibitor of apoptosis 1 [Anopheles bellator]XP_058067037.1 death-associated inhibitor of apoptosis 1 [Anopheles bellator]